MGEEKLTSIDKAILILKLLAEEPYEYKVADMADRLKLNRTTIYRTLEILRKNSMVILSNNRSETDTYMLGPESYHIGAKYLQNKNYFTGLNDILLEISELVRESVGIAIMDNGKIISIIEIEIHQPMKLNDIAGRYYLPNKGGYGKCLMAFQKEENIERYLDDFLRENKFEKTTPYTLTEKDEILKEYGKIRKRGYSLSIDEVGHNIVGMGIPIFGEDRQVKAALGVAFYKMDYWEKKMENTRDILLSYQEKISRIMV